MGKDTVHMAHEVMNLHSMWKQSVTQNRNSLCAQTAYLRVFAHNATDSNRLFDCTSNSANVEHYKSI